MGIQLDWQIQADQTQQRDQEDPSRKKQRRGERLRLLFAALFLGTLICVGVGGILWRLQAIRERGQEDLRASVETEFAAIRLGDKNAFMRIQRSASDSWLASQESAFSEYQSLKVNGRLSTEFRVVDVVIDKERGRAIIEEIIDRQPYQQVWFYWRYPASIDDPNTPENETFEGGWRRVPPDVTFWGDESTLENDHSSVTYQALDEEVATLLAAEVEAWWGNGCELLPCAKAAGDLEIIIDPQAGIPLAWEPDITQGWRLRILSPLLRGRVPSSGALPNDLKSEITEMLAERLIAHASANRLIYRDNEPIAYDTTWLKYQLRDWLIARWTGQSSPFLDSILATHPDRLIINMLNNLTDSGQINTLASFLETNTASLTDFPPMGTWDWKPFFAWRLSLENQRLVAEDFSGFYALYENGEFNPVATGRAVDLVYRGSPPPTINNITFALRADGRPLAVLEITRSDNTTGQIHFVWTGDTFVRVD